MYSFTNINDLINSAFEHCEFNQFRAAFCASSPLADALFCQVYGPLYNELNPTDNDSF
jgi:hypothetical protein